MELAHPMEISNRFCRLNGKQPWSPFSAQTSWSDERIFTLKLDNFLNYINFCIDKTEFDWLILANR